MSEIYKVNYTVNNNILKVFVFKGDNWWLAMIRRLQ